MITGMRPSVRGLPSEMNDTIPRAWGLHVRRERYASDLGRNVSYGSIATGSGRQQFRPCPLRPESGSQLAAV